MSRINEESFRKKYYEIKNLILTRNIKAIEQLLSGNLEKNLKHLKDLKVI